jgi:signal transduction histidine kinase
MNHGSERSAQERYSVEQLAAAGAIALDMRHQINNPLAALLAEAQVLGLEPLAPEQQEAVERIVELCRRVVALVRELDVATRGAVATRDGA